jgi:hypothetical protein
VAQETHVDTWEEVRGGVSETAMIALRGGGGRTGKTSKCSRFVPHWCMWWVNCEPSTGWNCSCSSPIVLFVCDKYIFS